MWQDGRGTVLVGYARTSTLEQEAGLEAQRRDLEAAGVDKIFSEQTSATGPRKALVRFQRTLFGWRSCGIC